MRGPVSTRLVAPAFTPAILRRIHRFLMNIICCVLLMGSASLSAEQDISLKLIFVTSEHCPFCKAWERDIGQIYDDTPYAQKAKLHRVDLKGAESSLPKNSASVFGTPTFIIVENNLEIGRIEGYRSRDMFFWALSEYISP